MFDVWRCQWPRIQTEPTSARLAIMHHPQVDNTASLTSVASYAAVESSKRWRKNSNDIKQNNGVSPGFDGFTSMPGIECTGLPTLARTRDAVDTFWGIRMMSEAKKGKIVGVRAMRQGMWIDASQQVSRLHSGRPGALCTGGLWFSYEEDACLDGQDVMSLQGFPLSLSSDGRFSSSEKRRLAGEAYFLGSFGCVAWAWFLNPWGAWWK